MQSNSEGPSLQWVTETTNGQAFPGGVDNAAFAPQGGLPSTYEQVASNQPQSQQHRRVQAWKEQWHLLRKREAVAIADVASSVNQGILKPQDLELDDLPNPATTSSAAAACGGGNGAGGAGGLGGGVGAGAGAVSMPQLRRRAWSQVASVGEAVTRVKQQLSQAHPGASYVVELTSSIQGVDQLLASFHTWNTSCMQDLNKQASQLEAEVEEAALRLEEQLLMGCSTTASTATTNRAPTAGEGHGVAAAGSGGGAGGRGTAGRTTRAGSSGGGGWGAGGGARAVSAGGTAATARRTSNGSTRLSAHPQHRTSLPGSSHSSGPAQLSARPGAQGPQGTLAPEVVEFEQFVAVRGEYGGWEREDHEAFEEILKACGGDYTHTIKVALERCVGFTKSELVQHASWHMDYMDLLVRKRMAVAAWRARRDHMRTQAQARVALLVPEPSQAPSAQANAERATATPTLQPLPALCMQARAALLVPEPSQAPAAQANAERAAAAAGAADEAREAAARKEQVAGWKARKDQAAREAAERAAQAAREAAQREEWERAERQHVNKLRLDLHKEIKHKQAVEAARAAARAAEEQRALQALDSNQVAVVAQRSAATFARRQELMDQKNKAAMRRATVQQQLLEQVRVEVPDDPQRVLKGTAAQMSRLQQKREEQLKPRDSDFILHVPHRQAPSWRAGLQGL